jgi:hypothetical protein
MVEGQGLRETVQRVSDELRLRLICCAMGEVALLAVLIFAAAILYSSVGHAGASGYLAAMALVASPRR